jgi:hypothetical protein
MVFCKICGKENCKEHSFFLGKTKTIKEFSGSSPPEIFVGKWDYPNVYTGILAPQEYGETKVFSSPELWHERKIKIPQILDFRKKLIYGRVKSNVKNVYDSQENKFNQVFKEIAMTSSPVATEFKLKKPIEKHQERESSVPLIKNAATISHVRLEENPRIESKVDYLVNDTQVKSVQSIIELNQARIDTSTIIKILSAGLLGTQKNRRLVPTRWSITAVDDTLSKNNLKEIRYYPTINEILVFTAEYLGNHYEFLLLPETWSFEVIEISLKSDGVWQDYEQFSGRKTYASSVTGAYYANRLALTEYLKNIGRQAQCLVMRQVSEEYYAPLGVGILRQVSREAFSKQPERFSSITQALEKIQTRLRIPITTYTNKSNLLKNYGKQQRLEKWF